MKFKTNCSLVYLHYILEGVAKINPLGMCV